MWDLFNTILDIKDTLNRSDLLILPIIIHNVSSTSALNPIKTDADHK